MTYSIRQSAAGKDTIQFSTRTGLISQLRHQLTTATKKSITAFYGGEKQRIWRVSIFISCVDATVSLVRFPGEQAYGEPKPLQITSVGRLKIHVA